MTRVISPGRIGRMKKPDQDSPTPSSYPDRVRASEAKRIEGGGRRLPGGVMPADAAEALDILKANGYGSSGSACIYRAIVDAAEQFKPKR